MSASASRDAGATHSACVPVAACGLDVPLLDEHAPPAVTTTAPTSPSKAGRPIIAAKDTACYDASRAMPDEPRRPSFASDFPRVPELDALVEAFARGDYARVRADAPKLASSAPDAAVCDAARTLLERTRPDRLAVALIAFTAVLLVALSAYWVVHGKAPPGGGTTAPTRPPVEHVK